MVLPGCQDGSEVPWQHEAPRGGFRAGLEFPGAFLYQHVPTKRDANMDVKRWGGLLLHLAFKRKHKIKVSRNTSPKYDVS